MSKSVDDLVAAIPPAQHGVGCWGERLTGRAAEFVEAVAAREATGVKLHRASILATLKKEFGVSIGQEALRKHILGLCRCYD